MSDMSDHASVQMNQEPVEVLVNGETLAVAADATISAVLQQLESPSRGVAVALNGEVVRRSEWQETSLARGDCLEVLTAAQGG